MLNILLALAAIVLVYVSYTVYCLWTNYKEASKLGATCIIVPFAPDNLFWIAFQTLFTKYLQYIPWKTFRFTNHLRIGAEYHDRYATHMDYGDPWILVSPSRNWLYVTDAKAISDIHNRGKDFLRPTFMLEALNLFGPNLVTAEVKDWQRQRKLTAAYFNETRSAKVWSESVRQSSDMLNFWLSTGQHGTNRLGESARTFALHVLTYVGFQTQFPFRESPELEFQDAASMTYRDSLAIILTNITVAIVIPKFVYSLTFLPKSWLKVGWAMDNFRNRMLELVNTEKHLLSTGQPGTNTLVGSLVGASTDTTATKDEFAPLTDSEILGNIFIFHFAGHDTSAITLNYALMLLVANPDVQDWIHEEITHYTNNNELTGDEYHLFPKLKRCLAVLYETLRLYDPALGTPRYTGPNSTPLTICNTTYTIPANWMIIPNMQSAHTHPSYWGSDGLVWRPQRWIENVVENAVENSAGNSESTISTETHITPTKGSFFPWAHGIRSCPGIKFAQVEFVAALASLFKDHRAEPVPLEGESAVKARERVLHVVKDSNVELLLQMRDPGSVRVRWAKRGEEF